MSSHAIAIAAGAIALASLAAMRVLRRMPDSPARHWLLLFAIAILPGLALALGASTAFEDAKRPEFCGSCHVMGPFIADLKNPASTTLAAVHYQNRFILENQCYTCHTDYGMFGTLEAKLAGARHLWKYESGTYELPIALPHYRVANCLHCHGESAVFRTKHAELTSQIEAGDVGCLDCHGPAHPARETRS